MRLELGNGHPGIGTNSRVLPASSGSNEPDGRRVGRREDTLHRLGAFRELGVTDQDPAAFGGLDADREELSRGGLDNASVDQNVLDLNHIRSGGGILGQKQDGVVVGGPGTVESRIDDPDIRAFPDGIPIGWEAWEINGAVRERSGALVDIDVGDVVGIAKEPAVKSLGMAPDETGAVICGVGGVGSFSGSGNSAGDPAPRNVGEFDGHVGVLNSAIDAVHISAWTDLIDTAVFNDVASVDYGFGTVVDEDPETFLARDPIAPDIGDPDVADVGPGRIDVESAHRKIAGAIQSDSFHAEVITLAHAGSRNHNLHVLCRNRPRSGSNSGFELGGKADGRGPGTGLAHEFAVRAQGNEVPFGVGPSTPGFINSGKQNESMGAGPAQDVIEFTCIAYSDGI